MPGKKREGSVLELSGGRRLGYTEYGDQSGSPLLYFHGTPGSRLAGRHLHEFARSHYVRLLALDRPGYGLSDFAPGRGMLEWADDMLHFADMLGLKRFSIWGASGGGPYALACARAMPERVVLVVLESSVGPFERAGVEKGMNVMNRLGSAFAAHAPFAITRKLADLVGAGIRNFPGFFYLLLMAGSSASDRDKLRRPEVKKRALRMSAEPFRSGGEGWAWEERMIALPWEFDPEDVGGEVRLYHGEEDKAVPASMARRLEKRLPNCLATYLPSVGHQFDKQVLGDIFEELFPGGQR